MTATREVLVLSGARTAIGDYGGSLKDVPPTQLGAIAVREAVKRSGVNPDDVGMVVFGSCIHSEPRDIYMSRVAAIDGGLSINTPCVTVNRLCGSGLQAIIMASQSLMLGDADLAVAGGAESMSRGGYLLPSERWGQRMGNGQTIDMVVGGLTDPFDPIHMAITAENVATQFDISREEQDKLAYESHRRAAAAIAAGYFKEQIVPVEIKTRKGTVVFDTDEHVRADASLESMAKLRPVFKKDGSVTAGNASGMNDAGAAVVLMEAEAAKSSGRKPIGRLVAYGHSGVDPKIMGIGPVKAVQNALKRAGLTLDQIDIIEANEAFAAQACAVAKELGFDPAKTNPNGSGISLGHPVGATGAILTIKVLAELARTGGRYGLATMCIGGGQGVAAIFERL
ncbi:MAG: acetyl-CoA C-acyltransferase family protein [Candidatus Velthaea sp.]|jgi:acetyl-CoA C-acetyltransferase